VIELHCDRIRQQMALSQTLLKRLNGIAQDLQTTQSVAVETLIETMETMTMTDTFDYILKAVAFASLAEEVMLQPWAQNYTPEALQVLDLGQSAVQALNLDVFGTEAMLLGLLAEGTSVAAQILATAGLTVESAVYVTHHQAEAMTMGTRIAVASRRLISCARSHPILGPIQLFFLASKPELELRIRVNPFARRHRGLRHRSRSSIRARCHRGESWGPRNRPGTGQRS
jgi:hypothetical protein